MDVVRQDDRAVKQVSEGHLAVDSPGGTDGQGGHALAQEQVRHQQQQGQERPYSNRRNTSHSEAICSVEVIKSNCAREAFSPLPTPALRMIWYYDTMLARVGKSQHLPLCKFRYVIIFAQIHSWRSGLLPAFWYCSQESSRTSQTFGA